MLSITKSINLSGQSKILVDENEVVAVQLNASLYNNISNSNVVSTIVNRDIYNANKETCRADIDGFTAYVRDLEDNNTESRNTSNEE